MCVGSVAQLYLTPCTPIDCSPPGSCVHGILQARILEWVVRSSSPPQPDQLIAEQAKSETSPLSLIIGWSEGTEHKCCGCLNFFKHWWQRTSAQREKEQERVNQAFRINKSGFNKRNFFFPQHVCGLPSLFDGHLEIISSPVHNCFLPKLPLCRKMIIQLRCFQKSPGKLTCLQDVYCTVKPTRRNRGFLYAALKPLVTGSEVTGRQYSGPQWAQEVLCFLFLFLFSSPFLKLIFIGAQLLYSVGLVSVVQQNESPIPIHMWKY